MRELSPDYRNRNFEEVCLGYTMDEAKAEAARCIQCRVPKCIEGCPVNIDIPGFIKQIKEDNFQAALNIIKKTNNLPGVCGRVCPQETQCEEKCILNVKKKAVSIGKLERFAADNAGEKKEVNNNTNRSANYLTSDKTNHLSINNCLNLIKVAIIGSGPAGLTCASDLACFGYDVTVFEAFHELGGVLSYGIPSFRLPKNVVSDEIELVKGLGVKFLVNMAVGKSITLDELRNDYKAIFIGTGAGLPHFLKIPGENLMNVFSANEFLTRVNLMKAFRFPEYVTPIKRCNKVVVIGGGNVAIDAARTALRLGGEVNVVYRRGENELPARVEEVHHAKEEGIKFRFLTAPIRILGNKSVEGMMCIRMELGESDSFGRRKPIELQGSDFIIECDEIIVAIGQGPNPLLKNSYHELKVGTYGNILVNDIMQTNIPNIFAGGDAISGSSTVIKAMGDGKKAAKEINKLLKNQNTL